MSNDVDEQPPSGMVTFLFTDIEASTRHMVTLGEAYDALLDLHDDLLRDVWTRHDGYEFNTGGDAFYVAFEDAAAGVHAAVEAQRAIAAAMWPAGTRLRVRMGLHRGYARPRRGDYAALAVNQTARVVGAAHGGQILLTEEVATQLADAEPIPTVRPLGHFRVRDFDEPPVLFGVEATGWEDPGLAPRVQPAEGHNIVRPTTALVGRDEDLEWVMAASGPGRLVTLVGPGGMGKTRLAVEAGLAVADRWPDGAWFVDLAVVRAGDHVAGVVASAVGATQVPGVPPLDDVLAHLRDREALVILDNCEHLTSPVAQLVTRLMIECPAVGLLATSRVPLGLRAEVVHRLAPLSVEGANAASVELFLERAPRLDTPEQLSDVVALCRELEGLPLALELAAARAGSMSAGEILRSVHGSPEVLQSSDPSLPERHRTIERVIEWSWELLDAPARTALHRLSVFAGSFDLDLAAVVCDEDPMQVRTSLWSLVENSLIRTDLVAGETRFRLPVPVRLFTATRREMSETRAALSRVADHYLTSLGPAVVWDRAWIGRVSTELDNLRGVVRDVAIFDQRTALALAWTIAKFHLHRGAYAAGRDEAREYVDLLVEDHPERSALLSIVADLLLAMGDEPSTRMILGQAVQVRDRLGPPSWDRTGLLRSLGEAALRRGDIEDAIALAEEILEVGVTHKERFGGWNLLGLALAEADDQVGALRAFERQVEEAEDGGIEISLSTSLGNIAELHIRSGRRTAAARTQLRSLEYARSTGAQRQIAFSVIVAAYLLADTGAYDRAAALHAFGQKALDAVGWRLYGDDLVHSDAFVSAARAALGDEAFARAVESGSALSAEEATSLAEVVLEAIGNQDDDRSTTTSISVD